MTRRNERGIMRCNEVKERLSAYLDHELDDAAAGNLTHHMRHCAGCREHFDDLEHVDALIKGLPELDLGPGFAAQVLARAAKEGALTDEGPPNQTVLSSFMQVFEALYDLLEKRKAPSTRTLEEFGDFPPYSMGCAYFKILGEPLGG
jgi:hypothetical protein